MGILYNRLKCLNDFDIKSIRMHHERLKLMELDYVICKEVVPEVHFTKTIILKSN
jgi:hypothetical protein